MKAMMKETERNRMEETSEKSKTNLMKALSKVEDEIDKVEKEIKQALRKKEYLEKTEKERIYNAKVKITYYINIFFFISYIFRRPFFRFKT